MEIYLTERVLRILNVEKSLTLKSLSVIVLTSSLHCRRCDWVTKTNWAKKRHEYTLFYIGRILGKINQVSSPESRFTTRLSVYATSLVSCPEYTLSPHQVLWTIFSSSRMEHKIIIFSWLQLDCGGGAIIWIDMNSNGLNLP